MLLYLFCSDGIIKFCDMMFYVSPVTIVAFLILSKLLRLCIWHKTACVLPILPQAVALLDFYVLRFPWSVSVSIIIMSIVMFALLLIAAYNVFMK